MASQGIRGEASLENEAGESHPQAGPQYRSPDGIGRGVPANQMETEAETDPIPPPRPSLGIVSPGSLCGDPRLGRPHFFRVLTAPPPAVWVSTHFRLDKV